MLRSYWRFYSFSFIISSHSLICSLSSVLVVFVGVSLCHQLFVLFSLSPLSLVSFCCFRECFIISVLHLLSYFLNYDFLSILILILSLFHSLSIFFSQSYFVFSVFPSSFSHLIFFISLLITQSYFLCSVFPSFSLIVSFSRHFSLFG